MSSQVEDGICDKLTWAMECGLSTSSSVFEVRLGGVRRGVAKVGNLILGERIEFAATTGVYGVELEGEESGRDGGRRLRGCFVG